MAKDLLIGIDVGTSGIKAAALSPDGRVLASASACYTTAYPHPGWVEQRADEWWAAICACLRDLFAGGKIAPSDIACVGIDGMSWCIVPVDKDGRALCATPIWMDTRAREVCGDIGRQYGADALLSLCGNPLQPGFSLPKLLWMKRHLPDVFHDCACVLEANSFIVYRLTGKTSMDPSQGFGWSCFDMRRGAWDESFCRELGVSHLLPPVMTCDQIVGSVTEAAAAETGLLPGTPVVAGGMDTPCGCLAAGVVSHGQVQEQGGQSSGIAVYTDRYAPDPRLMLVWHVCGGGYLVCGATVGGSASYAWFEREFGQPERAACAQGGSSFARLDRLAAEVPPGSGGLIFLPYMAGERTPIWDPDAKGVFFGLDFQKTRGHMARAVLEGVAYSLRDIIDTAASVGVQAEQLLSVGGAANSPLWMQIKADVTGRRMVATRSDVGSALGAAMLAGVGAGIWPDYPAAAAAVTEIRAVYEPNPANRERYDRCYEVYKQLYTQTRDSMKALNGICGER